MDRALSARDALAAAGFDLVQPFSAGAYAAVDGRGLAPLDSSGGPTRRRGSSATRARSGAVAPTSPTPRCRPRRTRSTPTWSARCAARSRARAAIASRTTPTRLVDMRAAGRAASRSAASTRCTPSGARGSRSRRGDLRRRGERDAAGLARTRARVRRALCGGDAGRVRGRGGWRAWLAVREACPVGGEHAYGPAQTRYHYTKERASIVAEAGEGARAACAPGEPSRRQGE